MRKGTSPTEILELPARETRLVCSTLNCWPITGREEMTDLTLKPTFIDRGGNQVYDVMKWTEDFPHANRCEYSVGQVRILPDPRIEELQTEVLHENDLFIEWRSRAEGYQTRINELEGMFGV
jgi:hypothetical protein